MILLQSHVVSSGQCTANASLNSVNSSVPNLLRSGECPTQQYLSWHLLGHTYLSCDLSRTRDIPPVQKWQGLLSPLSLSGRHHNGSVNRRETHDIHQPWARSWSEWKQQPKQRPTLCTRERVPTRSTQPPGASTLPTRRRTAIGQQTPTAPGILASIVDSTVNQIDCELQPVAVSDKKELCYWHQVKWVSVTNPLDYIKNEDGQIGGAGKQRNGRLYCMLSLLLKHFPSVTHIEHRNGLITHNCIIVLIPFWYHHYTFIGLCNWRWDIHLISILAIPFRDL